MYKLEVTLKQHTPLIHFQHDQEGATLRASEVKPKLDKFILTKLGDGDYEKGKEIAKLSGWLVGKGEHPALDYRMRVEPQGSICTYSIHDRFSLFFGNMGDGERKEFRFCDGLIKVIFATYNDEIIKIIEKDIASFFLSNNFGTRQSKGFGSFYLDNSDPLFVSPVKTELMDYRFKVNVVGEIQNQWKGLFEDIELFYKTLRSGINICNRDGDSIFYMKSIMFKYAKDKGLQWDKKSIKEAYYPSILNEQQEKHEDEDISDILHFSQARNGKYLFKDMLGLSSTENWRSPYRLSIKKESINNEIDRFKSPILFKPIRSNDNSFTVFFKGTEIPNNYLDKRFRIRAKEKNHLELKTYPDFDIDEFLDYAIFEVELEDLLGDEEYENHPKFKTIKNMFTQIRKDYGL
jgi:hypothetical protein